MQAETTPLEDRKRWFRKQEIMNVTKIIVRIRSKVTKHGNFKDKNLGIGFIKMHKLLSSVERSIRNKKSFGAK